MKNKMWIFAIILLIGGPSLLPFSLEVISLIELFGLLGLWTVYSSYAEYLIKHPRLKRGASLATCWDLQPQILFSFRDIKVFPPLIFHMFPVQSVLVWSLIFTFSGGVICHYVI